MLDDIEESAEKFFAVYQESLAGTEGWNELKPNEQEAWRLVAIAAIETYSPWSVTVHREDES